MARVKSREDDRTGAEIVYGAEACYQRTRELMSELGFPKGLFPLKNLEECGRVRETGFVWMKAKAPYEYFYEETKTLASYATEVTAYVEKFRMKRVTGLKSKQMFMWVPIMEICIEDPERKKISFKTPVGLVKSYPLTVFLTEEEEKRKYLELELELEN